jgi:two-component system alkaline phosphatase synthesis response regulator PhoP
MSTKKILVVDDEPDFVAVVKENLRHEGYDVEVAYNGIEALEKVKANPPDAIVLDVMMPEKNGYEVCTELKNDDQYCDIPIVLLTAVAENVTSSRYSHSSGIDMDADDFLSKPASPEEILKSLKALMD